MRWNRKGLFCMISKDKMILEKIIGYINDVCQCIQGFNFESFIQDKKTLYACAFAVSQIGELAKDLSEEI